MSVLIGRVPLFIKGELNTIFRKIKKKYSSLTINRKLFNYLLVHIFPLKLSIYFNGL